MVSGYTASPAILMLVLSTLHNLLSQVLSLPCLHTAVLLTPTGQLVSVASDPQRPKDDIRIVVGLAMEVWQETKEQDFGMIESEVTMLSCFTGLSGLMANEICR